MARRQRQMCIRDRTSTVPAGRPHQASDYTPLTFTDTLPNGEVVSRTRWALKPNLSTRNGALVENGDREQEYKGGAVTLSLIHISEPTRPY